MSAHALLAAVADLTAERDRESLEAVLSGLLRAQLGARSATYHRLVASDGGPRAWPVLRATEAGIAPLPDVSDPRRLPTLAGELAGCVERRVPVRRASAGGATWMLPVLSEHDPIGVVALEGVPGQVDPGREAAVANLLRIHRNHLALLDYGEHDTLTSLRNRRTFDADFARLQRDADRLPRIAPTDSRRPAPAGAPHWLAVVDVDRFKRINDEYGHLYGDEVLLILAQMMRAQFRPVDRLYRFGGEEFVVVLARTAPRGARAPFERLRAAVAARRFSRVGRVTVSIGLTRIGAVDDAAGAFGRADAALYHAKESGRDRVFAWEELVAAGRVAPARAEADVELF